MTNEYRQTRVRAKKKFDDLSASDKEKLVIQLAEFVIDCCDRSLCTDCVLRDRRTDKCFVNKTNVDVIRAYKKYPNIADVMENFADYEDLQSS